MTSAVPSSPPKTNLHTLPDDVHEQLCSYLEIGDIRALSKTCRDLCSQIREPAYVQRTLEAYRSSASASNPLRFQELNSQIRELEERLRKRREAPAEDQDRTVEKIERGLNTLRASRLPNDQIPQKVIDLVMRYHLDRPTKRTRPNAIDSREWNTFLIGEAPDRPLLPGTDALLREPCSSFPGKTKEETHVCIDIPPTVDGQPLTLNRILHFAEHNRGNQIRLNIYWDRILQELGDVPIPAGQLFLLKTCLPGTKNKTYEEQLEVLREHPEYMEATLLQVLVASLMEYIRSGGANTRLFEEEYARTSTTVDNWRLVFGGFGSGWPGVRYCVDGYAPAYVGLAVVLRRAGGSPAPGP